jgi:hypothetical protein
VLQEAKIKITDTTTLQSTITSQDMTNLASNVEAQFDNLLNQNSPFVKENTTNIINLRKAIVSVIKDNETLNSAQLAISTTTTVQNQDVTINFAPGMTDSIVRELGAEVIREEGRRPVIQIDQKLIQVVLSNAVINSIVSSIKNSDIVNNALANFGKNKNCEMTFREDPCNTQTNKTKLKGVITALPEGRGISCLNLARTTYPNVTWKQDNSMNFSAIYNCVSSSSSNQNNNNGEEKSDLEREIERDLQNQPSDNNQNQPSDNNQNQPSDNNQNQPSGKKPSPEPAKDNTIMYVGIAVTVVILIGGAFFLMKKK